MTRVRAKVEAELARKIETKKDHSFSPHTVISVRTVYISILVTNFLLIFVR